MYNSNDPSGAFVGPYGLALRHPSRPSADLPAFVAALVPSPWRSLEEWARFEHRDLDAASDGDLAFELERLRLTILLYPNDTPAWVVDRAQRLRSLLEGGAAA